MSLFRIIGLLIVFHSMALTQEFEPSSEFTQANDLYRSQDYNNAIIVYNRILDEGWTSFELFYNLAVSHNAIGEYDKAILYMQKAQFEKPNNKMVKTKLDEFRNAAGIDIIEIDDFLPIKYWNILSQTVSSFSWLLLQVIFSLLTITTLYFWLYGNLNGPNKRKVVSFSILFLFLFVLSYSLGKTSDYHQYNRTKGILMVEGYLYSGADERSDEVRPLKAGVYVEVLDKIDDWVKVRLRNKEEGWVEESSISLI